MPLGAPASHTALHYSCSFAKFAADFLLICVYLRNLRLKFFQRLLEVVNQVVGMLQSYRQAQEVSRAAGVGAFH
jgi:hypothetical protein